MVDLVSKKLKGIKKSTFSSSIGAALNFISSIRILNKWGEKLPILYDNCKKARKEIFDFSREIKRYMNILDAAVSIAKEEFQYRSLRRTFNSMVEYVKEYGWIFRDCNVIPYNGNYDSEWSKETSAIKFKSISSSYDNYEICRHIYKIINRIYENEISLDSIHECYSYEFEGHTKGLLEGLRKIIDNGL